MKPSYCIRHLTMMVCLIGILGFVPTSYADLVGDPQPPTIVGDVLTLPSGDTFELTVPLDEFEFESDTGKYKLKGEFTYTGIFGGTANLVIEEIEFDPDPSILHNILVTNTSGSTQTYTFTILQPTVFGAPNLISGSVVTSAIDGGQDGATVAAPLGGSIYNALIDGTTVQTLQDYDFAVVTDPGATSATSSSASFDPSLSNVAVTQDMGIRLDFSLTPGDTASILSRFDVVVPEPSTLVLLGVGVISLLAYAWRRRRR